MNDRIFGLTWDQIQRAQRGQEYRQTIDTFKPAKPEATDADRALLAEHGEQGLRDRQLFGVLDRLNLA